MYERDGERSLRVWTCLTFRSSRRVAGDVAVFLHVDEAVFHVDMTWWQEERMLKARSEKYVRGCVIRMSYVSVPFPKGF